jgi:hypothetical protein
MKYSFRHVSEKLTVSKSCRSARSARLSRWTPRFRLPHRTGTRAQVPPAMPAERHGRCGSRATWSPALPLPAAVPAGYGPRAESPASDLLWRLAARDCLMGVQLGLMGVQLGSKVIWAGFAGLRRRCGDCRAAAGGCHRASLMIKRSGAAAAVQPGPAAPSRLTAPRRFRRSHAWTSHAGRWCRLWPRGCRRG